MAELHPLMKTESSAKWFRASCLFHEAFLIILLREAMPVAFRQAKVLPVLLNKSLKSHSGIPSLYIRLYDREIIYVVMEHPKDHRLNS